MKLPGLIKKIVCTALVLLGCLTLSGCWNNRPITNLAIVVGLGFDDADGGAIKMTAQVVIPSALNGGSTGSSGSAEDDGATANVSVTGTTCFDAARNLLSRLNRKAYFGHTQILVFGSEFARRPGIDAVWDFMERDNEFNRTMRIIVVKDATAETLMNEKASIEKLNAIEIENTFDSNANYGKNVVIKSFELAELLGYPNSGIVVGLIDPGTENDLSKADASGGAVLHHGKLAGYLTPEETRGYLFGANEIKSTIIVMPNPKQKDKNVSIETIRSSSSMKTEWRGGKPVFSIDINTAGNLGDQQGGENLFDEFSFRALEKEAAELIRDDVLSAFAASQRLGSDIFHFDEQVYRTFYPQYKTVEGSWDSVYRNSKLSVTVKFHLDRTGMVTKPAF